MQGDGKDPQPEALEMIYRNRVEFAVGHSVSVHTETAADDPEHAVAVRTSILPQHELQITETPGSDSEDRVAMRWLANEGILDMKRLAKMWKSQLIEALSILTDNYAA